MATKGKEGNGHNDAHYCDSRRGTRVRWGRLLLEGPSTVGRSSHGREATPQQGLSRLAEPMAPGKCDAASGRASQTAAPERENVEGSLRSERQLPAR